ncbi:hypothetical protein FIBSPDRAFT_766798 [Athelia psychrophila]|uniref:Golgi apparatus membrane protein TVP38 n=1 Tax=Athelia psychrophila TaxID=1759441 RepID=A0A167VAL6_9AGAM|nr:hypothetical protein FIBSPDRAFT_766798 [Fibularhizoctonia sp. CBS 109695]
MTRTPSPTPSEEASLAQTGFFDWKKYTKFKKEYMVTYIVIIVITIILIIFAAMHNVIIRKLQPAAEWMHNTKFGWLIPIGLLFVMSFPPLGGQELVAILCGLVWGAGWGFLIVSVGQFLGELANFFTFKYLCQARSNKLKETNIQYACLSRVIQDGGLKVAVVARYSVIPPHVSTALFATCGMHVSTFIISALVSLPKNFINVYVGVTFEQEENGTETNKSKMINFIVLCVTILITIFAMRYIQSLINKVKPGVIHQRRKNRQAAQSSMDFGPGYPDPSTAALNPYGTTKPEARYPPSYNV